MLYRFLLRCVLGGIFFSLFAEGSSIGKRIEKRELVAGKEEQYRYDEWERCVERRDWSGVTRFSYDGEGFLNRVVTPEDRYDSKVRLVGQKMQGERWESLFQ